MDVSKIFSVKLEVQSKFEDCFLIFGIIRALYIQALFHLIKLWDFKRHNFHAVEQNCLIYLVR